MDESNGYGEGQAQERRISSNWNLTHESLLSMEAKSSIQFLQYRNYHLHLIQKKEIPTERRIIPTTESERLTYFRSYVSSPMKIQVACMYHNSFNILFWEYVLNSIFKSLQHTFATIFLASYAPEEHFFLSKMVPFMHGLKYCFMITGFLEVAVYVDNTLILLDYLVGSIFLKNPWNRCPKDGYPYRTDENKTLTIECYNVKDFGNRVQNKTVQFKKMYYYLPEDDENLQVTQIMYFRYNLEEMSNQLYFIYNIVIWVIIASCHNQIFRKSFWKMLNKVHWCVIAIEFASLVYLMTHYSEKEYSSNIKTESTELNYAVSFFDMDFIAESTTAPPIIHLLTARSTQEISPGRDSAFIMLSNALFFVFRAIISYKVKYHCENLVRVPILLPGDVENAWLYIWPMYFSTFFLGDIYTLIFLSLHFIMEIMITVLTFQCLVEVIVSEWPKIPATLVSAILIIIGIIYTNLPVNTIYVLTYNKSTATLLEVLVLYFMYPLFRLMDDIHFHHGAPVHYIRVQFLVIVPFYCMWKYYGIIQSIVIVLKRPKKELSNILIALYIAILLIMAPLLLGTLYATYRYVWSGNKGWSRLFAPTENWGPRDYNTRQLRKIFDSRTYNSSQAPRSLSRHILGKVESKTYRLDIRYDDASRRYRTERGSLED